jgi:6-phosphogluconolactonase
MKSLNRRDFLKSAMLAPAAGRNWLAGIGQEGKRRLLLAGTQTVDTSSSKGIYSFHWDPVSGDLAAIGLAAESENPTFLAVAPDARFLYAANEIESFEAQASDRSAPLPSIRPRAS